MTLLTLNICLFVNFVPTLAKYRYFKLKALKVFMLRKVRLKKMGAVEISVGRGKLTEFFPK